MKAGPGRRAALLVWVILTASAAQAATPLLAVQQPQIQSDMRDLSPLPRTPNESYTGDDEAAAPNPTPTAAARKKKKKTTAYDEPAPPAPEPEPELVSETRTSKSAGQKALDSIDVFYGFFLNGPSLGSSWGTTYSPFQQGTWPMYIYHTFDAQYHFDRANLVGFEASAHEDLFSGVTPSGFTSPVAPQFTFNDPQFWYTRKGVISNSYFSTDLQFSVWPAVTSYSLTQMGEYFAAAIDSTWNLNLRDRRWTTYLSTRIKPTVYGDLSPGDGYNREWLLLTTGYYVGYNLTPSWQVNLSGLFDTDFYANNTQLLNRGDGSDERAQLELNYFLGRVSRLGVYFQTVVSSLSLVSSIVGLDITVNLLSAK